MNILITGSSGFIGSALCHKLASGHKVVGADVADSPPDEALHIVYERADLTDEHSITALCRKHSSDCVIHCAGIAHQKIGAVSLDTYINVNSRATENFAKAAAGCNPEVRFIFLSSVSVYGEEDLDAPVSEESNRLPSSDYAASKLDAEQRLLTLYREGILNRLVILRLAPVYDREWRLNIERRILAPMGVAYIRFGSGRQKMSALARPNCVDFIEYLLNRNPPHKKQVDIYNVCDRRPYDFRTLIRVFKQAKIHPNRVEIPIPLSAVRLTTRIAGRIFSDRKTWLHACYSKLANDLVFDHERMRSTGFEPMHSIETIFPPQR